MSLQNVGIVTALHKPRAVESTRALHDALVERGVSCRVLTEAAEAIGVPEAAASLEQVSQTELVFVLGGDGSVLLTSREAAPRGTPVLPLELAGFGFLYDTPAAEIHAHLDRVLAGDFRLEERLLLEARVTREGKCVSRGLGLNDAVIAKGALSRVVHLRVHINDQPISHYPADGLIVATPTGSTAYSLSAGGPLVHPTVNVFLLTPICAHTLFARPLIVDSREKLRLDLGLDAGRREEVMLTLDGQVGFQLLDGDSVTVEAAAQRLKLVKLGPEGFYSRLQSKFQWGGGL